MTPEFTAIKMTYCDEDSGYQLRETIVVDARLVDEHGYIETSYISPGVTNLRDARTQGKFILRKIKERLTETS